MGRSPLKLKVAACLLTTVAACALSASATARQAASSTAGITLTATPGTVVRWSPPGTERCGMKGHAWPALDGVCYYPIDLLTKSGLVKITSTGKGHSQAAKVTVRPFDYPTQQVDLGDIPQANPTHEEMKQALREEAVVDKIWTRKEGPARFTLPLGAPATPLPVARDFGSKRIFNDTPAGQPHMGADYTINLGTAVHAVADGTVVLAEDQFFSGNAVYVDHGDGLVSMYFHLSKIAVKAGEEIRKGETLGQVGSTGRSSGVHLFFGVRWHNARIDPSLLLESPDKIQAVEGEKTAAKGE